MCRYAYLTCLQRIYTRQSLFPPGVTTTKARSQSSNTEGWLWPRDGGKKRFGLQTQAPTYHLRVYSHERINLPWKRNLISKEKHWCQRLQEDTKFVVSRQKVKASAPQQSIYTNPRRQEASQPTLCSFPKHAPSGITPISRPPDGWTAELLVLTEEKSRWKRLSLFLNGPCRAPPPSLSPPPQVGPRLKGPLLFEGFR